MNLSIEHTLEANRTYTWLSIKFPATDEAGTMLIEGKSIDITCDAPCPGMSMQTAPYKRPMSNVSAGTRSPKLIPPLTPRSMLAEFS